MDINNIYIFVMCIITFLLGFYIRRNSMHLKSLRRYTDCPIQFQLWQREEKAAIVIRLNICNTYTSYIRVSNEDIENLTKESRGNDALLANYITSLVVNQTIVELGQVSKYVEYEIERNKP